MNATQLNNTRRLLDNVSPTMCLAKWMQTSLHLESGHNRSCCHTDKLPIDVSYLDTNPSYLHNTFQRKQIRKELVEGKKPDECSICWNDEKQGDHFSDRIKKSSQSWSLPHLDKILRNPTADINPSYVELSFDNACNLKCSYCNLSTSSKWLEEAKQHGPYPTSDRFNDPADAHVIKNRDHNKYIETFWKWWPTLYPDLKVLRVNGGEPLLSRHTFKLLDLLAEQPSNIEFAINTNLSVPDSLIDLLIQKLNKLKVKSINVYTSCEGYGKKAEYARFGLDYIKWKSNCSKILNAVNCKLYVIASYNIFSPTSYSQFIEDTVDLRSKQFYIDTNFVRTPFYQSMFILDNTYQTYIEDHINVFEKVNASFFELNGIKRLLSQFVNRDMNETILTRGRKDFVLFVDEYDRRRGTDFLQTFPEMEEFYFNCLKPL